MSSKKEQQRKIREEKLAGAQRKNRLLGIGLKLGAVVMVPVILLVLFQGLFTGGSVLPPDAIGEQDHVRGNLASENVLAVYGDFQCPACREEAQIISRAWPQLRDSIKVVFRHYPLDGHRHAFLAARYTEAAGRQGRFWEMHDMLYANQALWVNLAEVDALFDGFAEDFGLDLEQLHADIEDPAIRDKVIADQKGGTRAGVRSTPSVFLNGRLIPNSRTAAELIATINKELAQ